MLRPRCPDVTSPGWGAAGEAGDWSWGCGEGMSWLSVCCEDERVQSAGGFSSDGDEGQSGSTAVASLTRGLSWSVGVAAMHDIGLSTLQSKPCPSFAEVRKELGSPYSGPSIPSSHSDRPAHPYSCPTPTQLVHPCIVSRGAGSPTDHGGKNSNSKNKKDEKNARDHTRLMSSTYLVPGVSPLFVLSVRLPCTDSPVSRSRKSNSSLGLRSISESESL